MNIRQSDTSFDDFEHDEDLIATADEFLSDFHKRTDLDLLVNNCASHTSSGHRCYLAALDR